MVLENNFREPQHLFNIIILKMQELNLITTSKKPIDAVLKKSNFIGKMNM